MPYPLNTTSGDCRKRVTVPNMKVRIGIADTDKVVEIEIEDVEAFQ